MGVPDHSGPHQRSSDLTSDDLPLAVLLAANWTTTGGVVVSDGGGSDGLDSVAGCVVRDVVVVTETG